MSYISDEWAYLDSSSDFATRERVGSDPKLPYIFLVSLRDAFIYTISSQQVNQAKPASIAIFKVRKDPLTAAATA